MKLATEEMGRALDSTDLDANVVREGLFAFAVVL